MTTFLDRDEVITLTDARRKATQIRVLEANRITFFLNASGWPVVLRSAIEGGQRNEKPKQRWSSNAT